MRLPQESVYYGKWWIKGTKRNGGISTPKMNEFIFRRKLYLNPSLYRSSRKCDSIQSFMRKGRWSRSRRMMASDREECLQCDSARKNSNLFEPEQAERQSNRNRTYRAVRGRSTIMIACNLASKSGTSVSSSNRWLVQCLRLDKRQRRLWVAVSTYLKWKRKVEYDLFRISSRYSTDQWNCLQIFRIIALTAIAMGKVILGNKYWWSYKEYI